MAEKQNFKQGKVQVTQNLTKRFNKVLLISLVLCWGVRLGKIISEAGINFWNWLETDQIYSTDTIYIGLIVFTVEKFLLSNFL